jgi:uncharacterized protein (TIGR00269 family)
MECSQCSGKAVFSHPNLCAEHLVAHVEATAQSTIDKYSLFKKSDRLCVAASGGKDSVALLAVLQALGYAVEALAVDEGIKGYRDDSLVSLREVCSSLSIPLRIVSFQEDVGKPLDAMVEGRLPCSVCGVFRRHLLNKYARGYDVIATGHNLDDEAQAVLMNLTKGHKDLLHRAHVRTPRAAGFVPRAKPFMFVPEKMILAYTVVKGLNPVFDECPYARQSFRAQVRDSLNGYEQEHPGMKLSLVEASLAVAGEQHMSFVQCPRCGEPSVNGLCRACELKEEVLS